MPRAATIRRSSRSDRARAGGAPPRIVDSSLRIAGGRRRASTPGRDDSRVHGEGLTLLLAEQSVRLALEFADYAYILQTGRTVLEGSAQQLAKDPQVQRVYVGMTPA